LGSAVSEAAQSSELFGLLRRFGLRPRQSQPSMGSLPLQLFCAQLTFENCDSVWSGPRSDWLPDPVLFVPLGVLPALPSVWLGKSQGCCQS